MNETNQIAVLMGAFIGSVIVAGVVVALGTSLFYKILKFLNWPKKTVVRLLISCSIIPVISLLIHADGPGAAVKYFIAAVIVAVAYSLRNPDFNNSNSVRPELNVNDSASVVNKNVNEDLLTITKKNDQIKTKVPQVKRKSFMDRVDARLEKAGIKTVNHEE